MATMIKLETNTTSHYGKTFYFNTIQDCERFKYVFVDHFCNVPWKKPEVVDRATVDSKDIVTAAENPLKRAEQALHWGFSLARELGIDLTADQLGFVRGIMNKV